MKSFLSVLLYIYYKCIVYVAIWLFGRLSVPLGAPLGVHLRAVRLHRSVVAHAFVLVAHVRNVAADAAETGQAQRHHDDILGGQVGGHKL